MFINKITSVLVFSIFIFFIVNPIAVNAFEMSASELQPNIGHVSDSNESKLKVLSSREQTIKNVPLQIKKLSDNQGLVYLGALISRADLLVYLSQMKQILGDDFNHYRSLQAARDYQLFHVTLLSPKEYQLADKKLIESLLNNESLTNFSNQLNVRLLGLGMIEKDNKRTFFVVAQSADGQLIRQRLLLNNKDFHVTLGFNSSDIYGVNKGESALINQSSSR